MGSKYIMGVCGVTGFTLLKKGLKMKKAESTLYLVWKIHKARQYSQSNSNMLIEYLIPDYFALSWYLRSVSFSFFVALLLLKNIFRILVFVGLVCKLVVIICSKLHYGCTWCNDVKVFDMR